MNRSFVRYALFSFSTKPLMTDGVCVGPGYNTLHIHVV